MSVNANKFEPIVECARSILPSRMKAKTIMWWITVHILSMCWYATLMGKPLDGSIAAIYGIAIGAFSGTKVYESYQKSKTTVVKEEHDV